MNEIEKNIEPLFSNIKKLIDESRNRVAISVNAEITMHIVI